MLKMIIADDEFIVRDGLRSIVPWEDFGIKVIAEAEDGQEAYELCMELSPDILLTDIRMPLMDGLEVALKLKENGSGIRVIIVSGIQDFNYAKTALNVNAEGYILKPVKLDELQAVVSKVVKSIILEVNRKSKMQELKQQLRENISIARDKFLRNLISGFPLKEQEIVDKFNYFQLPFKWNENLLVCVLQIDDYSKTTENHSEVDKQLLSFSVHNVTEEIMNNYNCGITFYTNENEFIVLFNQIALNGGKYMEICEEVISCISRFLQISVSIGIGSPIHRVSNIPSSCKDAVTALQYRFYTGKSSILSIADIQNISEPDASKENIKSDSLFEIENRLMDAMKLGDSKRVENILNELFDIFSDRIHSVEYIQSVCIEMVCIASRTVYEMGETIENIAGKRSTILDTVYCTENIFDLRDYMRSVFNSISTYFSRRYNQKNSKIIIRIKDIIHQKYRENIGVSKISEEVYLTPNYISLIFKQETGETITEYITKVRMEAAKELLRTTDFKVLEVAEMVGFDNPQYFSTVFKKYTGVHPGKYRS